MGAKSKRVGRADVEAVAGAGMGRRGTCLQHNECVNAQHNCRATGAAVCVKKENRAKGEERQEA